MAFGDTDANGQAHHQQNHSRYQCQDHGLVFILRIRHAFISENNSEIVMGPENT